MVGVTGAGEAVAVEPTSLGLSGELNALSVARADVAKGEAWLAFGSCMQMGDNMSLLDAE